MQDIEMLTVEDSFHISELGVVVVPDFSVPDNWQNRSEIVGIVNPDGKQFDALVHFRAWHFNIPDPKVTIDKRWRVVALFPDLKKEDLKNGSRIFVSAMTANAILPQSTT